ncbi:MAG TPA: hypothetical protein PKY63_11305 [Bacteroidales bacterium]|nr:hypothetical protein [Bacteroidales bacterium]
MYETFYTGDSGVQYFIKPLNYSTDDKSVLLRIDFAFRYLDSNDCPVITNISLINKSAFIMADSLSFSGIDNAVFKGNTPKLLFKEVRSKSYITRYSSEVRLNKLTDFFKNGKSSVFLNSGANHFVFHPVKKTKRHIEKLNRNVFPCFE